MSPSPSSAPRRSATRALGALLASAVLSTAALTPIAVPAAASAPTAAPAAAAARVFDVTRLTAPPNGLEPSGDIDEEAEVVVSGNGRYAVFSSHADELVPGQTESDSHQLYRRDLTTGEVELVTANKAGQPSNGGGDMPSVSADGRYIAFESSSWDMTEHPVRAQQQPAVHPRHGPRPQRDGRLARARPAHQRRRLPRPLPPQRDLPELPDGAHGGRRQR
jgi:hypothetical protein